MAQLTETVLRDGHQSLLATRVRTEDMLEGAERLDKIGYRSIEMWGGATFDVCMRFLNENPWERLRRLKAVLKNTPTQMLLRGQNLVGYTHYSDDVVDLFVRKAAENGVDVFRVFDALNDLRNMERAIAAVLKAGAHAQGAISYTRSHAHSVEQFVVIARHMKDLGCQSICVKDMAGLLTPSEAFPLIAALKKDLGMDIWVHSHNTSGYAQLTYFAAIQAGAAGVDCALSPLSNGTSQPPTESMVAGLRGTEWDTGYKLEAFEPITALFTKLRDKYTGYIDPISERVDVRVLTYQVPGGMISNLVNQLKQQGKLDRFEDVLAEVPAVRADLGFVPLVTPTSQIIGTQAVLNVLMGERYKMVTKETRALALGRYGRTPVAVSPEIIEKLGGGEEPITDRPADHLPPVLDDLRTRHADLIKSDDDLLMLAMYGDVAARFLRGEAKAEPIPERKALQVGTPAGTKGEAIAFDLAIDGEVYHAEVRPAKAKPEPGAAPTKPKPAKKLPRPAPYSGY